MIESVLSSYQIVSEMKFERLQAWFVPQTERVESESGSSALSENAKLHLQQVIAALAVPESYRQEIVRAVGAAIAQWSDRADAPNRLAILSVPIEPLNRILPEAIASSSTEHSFPLTIFPAEPSGHPAARVEQFIAELGSEKQLVMIPSLSRCFLRCIGELDGIEALQKAAFRNPQHFWLVGCNRWAWQYLHKTHQLRADFEQTLELPLLLSRDLQTWLEPAAAEVDLELESETEAQDYFEQLAELSLGLSSVAGKLWLNSLRDRETESSRIGWCKPERPKLPKLEMSDRYLLYSLLLHEALALPELALSLGDSENLVRASLQRLQQLDLLKIHRGLFSVNPLHYPKLLADLGQNNFLADS